MGIDDYFDELLKKFKSELERKENYDDDDVCFPPFKRLNHLEVLKEVRDLCDCARDEIRKKPEKDRKAYLKKLKNKHEELIRKPLFNLIDEAYYYTKNVVYLHDKEKQGIETFLKPAYECNEDVVNKYQAIKTYRYNLQSTDEYVVCDYAVEVINEIWCRIERDMLNEIPNEEVENEEQAESETYAKYSPELLKLFKNHTELINELVGKSDNEILKQIQVWAREKDKYGKTLIENPANNLRAEYARELKNAGIINLSAETFRRKL